jgi:hypothetical protein
LLIERRQFRRRDLLVDCMECGEWMGLGDAVIISRPNGHEEYRVHAGGCTESVKKKLKGDVVVREITKADVERYKSIHEKFVKMIKETYPTD